MSVEQRSFNKKSTKAKTSGQVACRSRQHVAAQVQLNGVICAVADQGGTDAVLNLVQARHVEMNLVNLSTALHRIARSSSSISSVKGRKSLADKEEGRMALLHDRIREELQRCAGSTKKESYARCLSTISWSFARLQTTDRKLMRDVGDLAALQLSSFKPLELANLLYGFAKLRMSHDKLFQLAHGHIMATLSRSSAANLSMFAWSFATIKFHNCADLFVALTEAFASLVTSNDGVGQSEVNPVVIENMVWALATARVRARRANLRVIGNAATCVLGDFKAHELAITLWAFARLDVYHEELFTEAAMLLQRSKVLRNSLHAQGVTNILWAFARHAQHAGESKANIVRTASFGELLSDVMPVCERLLPDMKPIEISTTIKAVSSLSGFFGAHPAVDRFFVELANQLSSERRIFARLSPESALCMLATCNLFFQDRTEVPEACKLLIMRLMRDRDAFGQPTDDAAEQYQLDDDAMRADGSMLDGTSALIAKAALLSDQTYPIEYGDATDEAALLQACQDAIGSGVGFPIDLPSAAPTVDAECTPREPVYLYPSCTLHPDGTPLPSSPSSALGSSPAYVYPSFIDFFGSEEGSSHSGASTTTSCRVGASKLSSSASSEISWNR